MTKKYDGFKDFGKQLSKAANNSSGNVSFDKLFSEGFMAKHSNLKTIGEMFDKAGITIESEADFEALPEATLNSIVKQYTSFSSWEVMLGKAGEDYMANEIKKRLR
ncbi:MAG: hypothetical protein AVO34_14300 [Firmicutes bacterium ML8_F2]|jgi:hypothetical protein|nr:MAG: hypothetical protein AVO34_14300 [Firmicutes bacterium ML8_F2]